MQHQLISGQAAQGGMMMPKENFIKQGGMNINGGDQSDITKVWDTNNFKKWAVPTASIVEYFRFFMRYDPA